MIFNLNQQISRIHLRIFRFVLLCGVMLKKKMITYKTLLKKWKKWKLKYYSFLFKT